jgi:hypothetical protein
MREKLPVLDAVPYTVEVPAHLPYPAGIADGDDGISYLPGAQLEVIDTTVRIDDEFAVRYGHRRQSTIDN